MSLIININSLSYLYDYLDLGVHDFIVGTNQFSCRQALTVDYIELKEIKEKYEKTLTAPTMGNAHVYSEYKTKWGKEKKYFEQLTAANYIKILFEEYRWKNKKAVDKP